MQHGVHGFVSDAEIPKDVKRLIGDHIESVVQLEILLLLYANAGREFTAADVGRELRIEPAWVITQLANLCGRGILCEVDARAHRYRYKPTSAQLDAAVAGLARAYADRRVTVVGLIYAKPPDQIRSFADAFRLRKERDDG